MNLETLEIKLNNKKYTVTEPTINKWSNVMKFREIVDEEELYIKMISEIVGISRDEILECDSTEILTTGEYIYRFINKEAKKLYPSIQFKGTEYELVDIQNVSFGQYVDIDTFLRKDESYRVMNLNELAAYLYTEKGIKYGESNIKSRIELFRDLPIKYIESSIFFLLSSAKVSQELLQLYSHNKFLWWTMRTKITLVLIGDGIKQYLHSRKTRFGKLMTLLISPLLFVLITCRILLTKTGNKKG
jgi:hypothetical protein